MSRSELVGVSGGSKQQLSPLEGGQIRMRLDHLKPFAKHLGYTPEQILLWGRYPGTGEGASSDVEEPLRLVPELDTLDISARRALIVRAFQNRSGPSVATGAPEVKATNIRLLL